MRPNVEDLRVEDRQLCRERFFVRYRLKELDGLNAKHASRLDDYSNQGIKLVSMEPMSVGQVIRLNLFSMDNSVEFELTGEVKWCLEVDQIPTYHAGVGLKREQDIKKWRSYLQAQSCESDK
ncbi:MAG: PilZ domain-containing protein [Kangiellaceae bacterium]|jgi:hypothetical protein|nr:PilZ domain-containing protein [Kangiellaceae bacterium]